MEELGLMDFLSVFKRRIKLFLIVFGVFFCVSVVFAFNWSNYRSFAMVEVALPEVDPAATSTTMEGVAASRETFADLRISYLQQKVLSTGSLVEIITKYDLYADARRRRPIADIAEKMRNKVRVDLVGGSFANAATASKAPAGQLSAIAFKLSFDYGEPLLAQQVTNEIVTRFLEEDIKQRRTQAQDTTAFLSTQLKVLETSLAEQEKKIADFRAMYGETRPEALAFNQQAATSLMLSLQNLDSQIASNLGTQGALKGQLAATDPYSRIIGDGQILTTPTTQLRALKSEHALLVAKYGPQHPDVIKSSRQIKSMEAAHGNGPNTAPIEALMTDAKAKLETLRKTYGPENPEIISLEKQIKSYGDQIEAENKKKPVVSEAKPDADNPAYLQIVAQLRAAQEQGEALKAQREALQQELNKHQQAVVANPAAEQQLAALTRDYDNAQLRYRELKARKMQSEMNEAVEQERVGQRLLIINPPELPLKTQPSRLVFLLAGFVLSFLAGAAAIMGMQLINPSVIGPRHLESVIGVAPLVTIPHIMVESEKFKITEKHKRYAVMVAGAVVLVSILFSYLVMPFDVLLSVLALKLGLG